MTTGAAADAREQLARLQAVTAALSEAATTSAIARALVQQLVALVGADAAGVFRLEDDAAALELIADEGIRRADDLAPHARIGMDTRLPVVDAVRERRPLWLTDAAAWAPYLEALAPTSMPAGAVGIAPIVAASVSGDPTPRGALFVFYGEGRVPSTAERELVHTIARLAAPALERARLLDVAEHAADRTARLQRVTGALARAATPEEVAGAIVGEARDALGADTALVFGLRRADELELLAQDGFAQDSLEPWRRIPLTLRAPVTDAVRTAAPVVFETLEAVRAAYPDADELDEVPSGAVVAVPMLLGDAPRGAVFFGFGRPRHFAAEDRDIVMTIAELAAQALERSSLHAATQTARLRADRMQETTAALASTLTREDVARVVTTEGVSALGAVTGGLMAITRAGDELELLGIAGFTPDAVRRFKRIPLDGPFAFSEAVRQRRTSVVPDLGPAIGRFPHLRDVAAGRSVAGAIVPLLLGERATGALAFGFSSPDELDDERVTLLTTLAQLAAQALDRARLYEAEHEVASRLQTSLLPDALPALDDAEVAARYLPGTAELEVGGDWYDVLPLFGGRVALVAGDVVGRGLPAASAMGRLRAALAALAHGSSGPGDLLDRVDGFARRGTGLPMATVVVAVIDPLGETVRYACAGHPPPVLVTAGGDATLLHGGRSAPLGAFPGVRRDEAEVALPAGSTLVLYTDGLVERRGESLDRGLERLAESAARHAPEGPEDLCAGLLADLVGLGDRHDDIAVLAARTTLAAIAPLVHRMRPVPRALAGMRRDARAWLHGAGVAAARADDLMLALNEAVTNAIEHSGGTLVDVRLRAPADGGVIASVEDDGRWRAPAPDPGRGRGMALMRSLVDELHVVPEHGGTTVTLRCRAR